MNKLLVGLLIVQAAFAVNSEVFHSQKLAREGTAQYQSKVQYIKTNDLRASLLNNPREFFEAEFATRIDHFRPLNQQRVNFTYNVNTFHYNDNGPLYIYLKDAFDYSTQFIEEGLMVDIAEATGGALLTYDSRYFGRNRPFDSASFDDLELLSVEQALADTAEFVRVAKREIPNAEFSRVIVWGSGVGGTNAVFARSRYPHLIDAAWSSSGIFESAVYSWGPYDVFAFTFDEADTDGQCRNLIEEAYEEIVSLVLAGEGEELGRRLNLCHAVDTDSVADTASLYEVSVRAVMYYLENFHFPGVLQFCADMQAIPGQPLDSLARWYRYVYGDSECFDPSYATAIERYSNPEWDQVGTDNGRRQWYFLQCTQVASFLVADGYTWLPGTVSFNYHLQKCEDLFGATITYETITEAFYTLRAEFATQITNAIYTNGNLDPIRYFGRLSPSGPGGGVFNIDYASKSADLSSISVNEPESIYAAKRQIVDIVTRWASDEPPVPPPPVPPPTESL